MPYLPRNQVIQFPLQGLKDFHQCYQSALIKPYGSIYLPASFHEDLWRVINYFNKTLTDDGLMEYIQQTPYEEHVPIGLREEFMYEFYRELENPIKLVFQLSPYSPIPDEIQAAAEGSFMFVVDTRGGHYVPARLYRALTG